MTLDSELLGVLACPVCRGGLVITEDADGLSCSACAVVYPIRDDIPVMLAEEAVPVREWTAGRHETGPGLPKPS